MSWVVQTKPPMDARALALFQEHERAVATRTSRLFAILMVTQWLAGIAIALWVSPRAWQGIDSYLHPHVWAAVVLNGVVISVPVFMAVKYPAAVVTRHIVAIGQILTSAVLIHLMGGRIEAHFHIFGSLAFLAFYRDWRVLITASVVVALDHYLRGLYWPQSVYGTAVSGGWRWLEHTAWVVFEDSFLIIACRQSTHEMQRMAAQRAELELTYSQVERKVTDRTAALHKSQVELERTVDLLRAADAAKGRFLANLSHELRTSLNGIIGMSDLVLDTKLDSNQHEIVETTKSCAESLATVIEDVLDYSTLESGKRAFDRRNFDLDELLAETLKPIAVRAQGKRLGLALHVHPDVPGEVFADPDQFKQVISNLVGNAIKFTHRGEVVVEVSVESPAEPWRGLVHRPGCIDLHFSVRDTGVGIAPEMQRAIFLAFEQAECSTTRLYGGMGLGLAIASKLVAAMGGRLWLESEVGVGSCFHFTVPVGLVQSWRDRPDEMRKRCRGMHVLIVDDNASTRDALAASLKKWEMRPHLVDDAREALGALKQAHARRDPYELALIDTELIDADGLELVRQIRAHREYDPLTVLMIAPATRLMHLKQCHDCRIAGVLSKPVEHSQLWERVREAVMLRRRRGKKVFSTQLNGETGKSLMILLAESSIVNQRIVAGVLEKRGHTVVVVEDGRAAYDVAVTHCFDVILLDLHLPVMSGLEAICAIREWEANAARHTPIITLAAPFLAGVRKRALAAGADDSLPKPVRARQLLDALAKLVAAERDASPNEIPAAPLAAVPGDPMPLATHPA